MVTASAEKTAPQIATSVGDTGTLAKRVSNASYATYRKMRRDPTIGLARALICAPVLASQWSVEATDKAPQGAKDFVTDALLPLRLHVLRTALLGNVDFGWQGYEKVLAQRADGLTYVKKLKPLLQDKTDILVDKETGAYAGLYQIGPPEVSLAVEESLLISLDVEGTDWYGESRMESAKIPYDQWNAVDAAASRYDRKIAGAHWIIKYPIGSSDVNGTLTDNFEVAKTMLAALEASGGIVVPRMIQEFADDLKSQNEAWDINIKSPGGPAQYSFVARLSYIDKLKVRAIGLPERSVLEGEFGTKAEAAVHADLAITNMELRHLLIVQHVNWHVANHLLRINYGPETENSVYVTPQPLTDVDREWLQKLYTAVVGNENGFLTEYGAVDFDAMRERLGIPTKPEQDIDLPGHPSQFRGVDATTGEDAISQGE